MWCKQNETAMSNLQSLFQAIPSMDRCLSAVEEAARQAACDSSKPCQELIQAPHLLVREALAAYWNRVRQDIRAGTIAQPRELGLEARLPHMLAFVCRAVQPRLRPVCNGTGVIIHTNTGRSLLAREAQDALLRAASGNTTLEFNEATGGRGSRNALVSRLLQILTGAEDGLVVNNNAAAVLLVLDTFCRNREAVISRGELVEIGGSFRIPDVMEATGVRLREVGATNRTHLEDYERAICDRTGALVRVHTSNFRIIGFHTAVPTRDLARLAHDHGLLLINDLGSGSLVDLERAGLPHEPTVQQSVADGSDLVLFSGDKLLGGPQAGIIVGKKELLARLRENPLLRALRCDKLVYAALEATLRLYLEPQKAVQAIPTLRQILMSAEELSLRAERLASLLATACQGLCEVSLRADSSRTGGGAFPEYPLPTTLVVLKPLSCSAEQLKQRLLGTSPLLLGRIEQDAFCLDPRTLNEEDFDLIVRLVHKVLQD